MRVAIAAGGSGGHIIPALTVLGSLREREPGVDAAFFGPDNRGERDLVAGHDLEFHAVPSAAIRGRGPIALIRASVQISRGIATGVLQLRRYGADVIFSTGGYGSFPSCVAARLLRRPVVIFLPDVEPGWAVRVEKRLATKLATTTQAALDHLPRGRSVATGYPVRPAFFTDSYESARERLGIPPDVPMILVAGASQGALAINRALFAALPDLLSRAHVFHLTGRAGAPEAEQTRSQLDRTVRERYHPAAFRDDMPALMLAADLAVMRSGASVLGELPAAELPAILVPGTFAGGHQADNARWLSDRGAAVILAEADINDLGSMCLELLEDRATLKTMRVAAAELARPDAAAEVASLVEGAAR